MEMIYFCKMKSNEIIMVGAGGHALSLAEFAGSRIMGYLARESREEMPGEWLGDDDAMQPLIDAGHLFHMAFVYAGLPVMTAREELLKKYEDAGARFLSLISPSAIVTPHSRISEGCAILSGAIVNRSRLGKNVIVNSGAIVEHDCMIGQNTFIGPGAVIGGFTSIGKNCFIGLGARIGNGLTIADNVTVAMGAVVNRNLKEPGIYHGFPLRLFKLK